MVDSMIRRSVRKAFHTVWWNAPTTLAAAPVIFAANHHGWHDGYLMYHVVTQLGLPSLDWIDEFDAFPLFAFVGGMPFSHKKLAVRAATIRSTIRSMNTENRSLILFPEGVLHPPPEVLAFGRSLDLLCRKVPSVSVVPVGIRYELSLHERPEAFLHLGEVISLATRSPEGIRERVIEGIGSTFDRSLFTALVRGTRDVNERWDMRNIRGMKRGP
jgi:1-acyl-sn-glycerol-3-phosphate acyltransferase